MKRKVYIRIALSVVALAIMALVADVSGEHEVIFPEVAALAVGLWIADKRMWNVREYEIPLLMTISAVLGVLITTYVNIPIFLQLTLAFFISAFLMSAMRIPLIPAIAAILLPVLLHTESWFYPASVGIMTTIMAIGASLLQLWNLKTKMPGITKRGGINSKVAKSWALRYAMLFPLLVVATWNGWLFAIVPPLVIILIELSSPNNMFRSRPITLWVTVLIVSVIGTGSRYLILETLGLPYAVSVSVAFFLAVVIMRQTEIMFPPIPALAVIPFILPASYPCFPLEVAFGGAYVIAVPLLMSKSKLSLVNRGKNLKAISIIFLLALVAL